MSREHSLGIEEVELNHIEAPLVDNNVEEVADIFSCFGMIEVERVSTAPALTAEERLALCILNEPVGMLLGNS